MRKTRKDPIKRKTKIIRAAFLLAVLTAGIWIASMGRFSPGNLSISGTESAVSGTISAGNGASEQPIAALEIHFIDVGQGDSTLIVCDGEAMLIDAGDNSMGTTVRRYLTLQNVDHLEYVIGTHPDADHIGGLDVILYKLKCETIIMPDRTSEYASYRDVIDVMENKGYKITYPQIGEEYALGDAGFTILGPRGNYQDDNNCSVILRLAHGENTFLFTGDAEEEAEQALLDSGLDISAAVLKVGHHGSSTSTSQDFLNAVSPQYAVISCGTGNDYGHPHRETLQKLQDANCRIFRTDEQGSVVVYSDGAELTWSCEPWE